MYNLKLKEIQMNLVEIILSINVYCDNSRSTLFLSYFFYKRMKPYMARGFTLKTNIHGLLQSSRFSIQFS